MDSVRAIYDRTSYILIVDDDDVILKFFKIHLNKFFSKIIVVSHQRGIEKIFQEKNIDLVIADVYLSSTTGFKVAQKIKKIDPTIPILFISGGAIEEAERSTMGTSGFLKKPFSMEELHDFIRKGLVKRQKMRNLFSLVQDMKKFVKVMDGRLEIDKVVPEHDLKKARALVRDLHKAA
ncbi:MAG: response regulator [Oligoflexales bacterium]|nr:response regulator [Oligoflexales bacterium]